MKDLKKSIIIEYQQLRDKALLDQAARKIEIHTMLPRIKEIEDEIAKISIESGRSILFGGGDYTVLIDRLRQKIEALHQEKAFLMTENNIPMTYMETHFQCDQCSDTGYVDERKMCTCFRQKLTSRLYEMSNISRSMEKQNFKTFDLSVFSDQPYEDLEYSPRRNMERILANAEQFVYEFGSKERNLMFYGATGLGKTFMCNAIAKALMEKGHTVVYQTSFKILEILERNRFRKDSEDADQSLQYELLFDSDLLIIDDLGTEMVNAFTNSEMFNIVNSRIIAGKSIIISTNLSPAEIMSVYSNRISSRVFGTFDIFFFYGPDLRWETKRI